MTGGKTTLNTAAAQELVAQYGAPLYVYDGAGIRARAKELTGLELPYGLTVRYAVKANPHPEIINMFAEMGLSFDASSSFEAAKLLQQGIAGERISLSSQQPAHNLPELLRAGVRFVATSLHQLELFAAAENHLDTVGLRVNPGMGHGHSNRLTTGGAGASFGLWHEYLPQALQLAAAQGIRIDRLHVHVGTGGDPGKWGDILDAGLHIVEQMPDVTAWISAAVSKSPIPIQMPKPTCRASSSFLARS